MFQQFPDTPVREFDRDWTRDHDDRAIDDGPPHPLEPPISFPRGRWTNRKGYRSNKLRFRILIGLIVIGVMINVYLAGLNLQGASLIDRFMVGTSGLAELERWSENVVAVAGVALLLLLPSGVMLLAWASRAIDNAPELHGGTPPWSPRWFLGWWFIPVANFVMPFRIIADLNRRMAWSVGTAMTWLVVVWWLVLLFDRIVGQIIFSSPADTLAQLRDGLVWTAVGAMVSISSLVLTALVVWRIQRHSDFRIDTSIAEAETRR